MERRHSVSCVVAVALVMAFVSGCSRSAAPNAKETPKQAAAQPSENTATACELVSDGDVAAAVGNPVLKGAPDGTATCKWDTEKKEQTSALLMISRKGSYREPYLCDGLRKKGGNERVEGLDVATWTFSKLGFFNSGDFEACGPKGWVSLSLSGQGDEARLKQATLTIVRQVLQRM